MTLELAWQNFSDAPVDPCSLIGRRLFSTEKIPERRHSWAGHLPLAGVAGGDLFFDWLASDGITRPGHCLDERESPER